MTRVAAALIGIVAVAGIGLGVGCRRTSTQDPGGGSTPQPNTPPVASARIPPFSPALVGQLTALLGDAGVQVVLDATVFIQGDASAVTGFAVSEFQVRNMAVEIGGDAGGGFYGAQLDEIAEMPPGAPPISYFVAAWLVRASSPAAKSAAGLMGPRDYRRAPEIVFPSVVLAAFVGDALRAASAGSVSPQASVLERFHRYGHVVPTQPAGFYAQASTATPCSIISNFISGMLAVVFDRLKIQTDVGGVLGFFVDLYNAAVELAKQVVKGLIEVLGAPVLQALKVAIGLVGVASYASSLLRPWAVRVAADPNPNRFAIDKEPQPTGMITARIDDKGFPGWPKAVVDCAKLVNVELPSPDADVGSPVRWRPLGGARSVLEGTQRDDTLPADKVARLSYIVTGRETKQDVAQGKEIDDIVTVQAGIERSAITGLRNQLQAMFLGMVPGALTGVMNPLLSPITDKVLTRLAQYVDANGSTILRVRHHTLIRCLLFTKEEASSTLRQNFTIIAAVGTAGCSAGVPGGPSVGYQYDRLPCRLLKRSVALTGVNDLPLGPNAFYTRAKDTHVVAFPPLSAPNFCVQIVSGPVSAIAARDVVRLAGLMRPRS